MRLFRVTPALGGDLRHQADGWSRMHLTRKRGLSERSTGGESDPRYDGESAFGSTPASPGTPLSNRDRAAGLSDQELMAKVSAGGVASFVDLYDRYYQRAYRVARAVCRDDGRAQEAVQDGFLSVWNSRARYSSQQGTVAAWVLTVVRYRAIDIARRNGQHASRRASDDQLADRAAPGDPFATAAKRDDAQRLRVSLASLPDAQAEVITLAYYGQLSHAEIAGQLGLPTGTVKGRMRLGLEKLRADIEPAAS
jgi:RNA polymerase sigma-70 factor, ECF subfamily